uniref:Uncharacterized protein n=1 Tax=Rhizophora mucronata TaxID=61149 RepID=A0A2P2PGM4_RHIMU
MIFHLLRSKKMVLSLIKNCEFQMIVLLCITGCSQRVISMLKSLFIQFVGLLEQGDDF